MLAGQPIHRYKEKGAEGLKMSFACCELVCGRISSIFAPVRGMNGGWLWAGRGLLRNVSKNGAKLEASLNQNPTSSFTFCQKTNWNFGVGENFGKSNIGGFINAGSVLVVLLAQKRNSNFGVEHIYGIRTACYTLHLILFVDNQAFRRFTYSKSEIFYLFSLLLLTSYLSIQKLQKWN